MVILEGELVFPLLRHLHPHSGLPDPSAFGLVGFQQVFPGVAVKAALAEVFALPVLALVVQEPVEVLDPGVVKFSCLLD